MSAGDFVLKSRRVVTREGVLPASVHVEDGAVARIMPYRFELSAGRATPACPVIDAGENVVMAGLVDTHVHVNEPGRAEWEGFRTATAAAAAGGITTLVDMPLNSDPVTTSAAALKRKLAAAEHACLVDCGFWGGVVPGNARELEPMVDAGVLGFKCFLVDSGLPEFPPVGEDEVRAAMKILARRGVPLLVHAELACAGAPPTGDRRRYRTYLDTRPPSWENEAVRMIARLCAQTGCRAHIVHLSSAEALPILSEARAAGAPLSAETCPHYLTFCDEEIPDGRTEFKCSPPIRGKANREKLWEALGEGVIDCVVSDHSPCLPELKKTGDGDFLGAWGGISSLQFTLPVVWTEARRRGFPIESLAGWLCANPARLAGLDNFKGRIAPGLDADLVVWDPDAEFTVEGSAIRHRHRLTPYAGARLSGAVLTTFSRGVRVYERGEAAPEPTGRLLLRSEPMSAPQ